VRWKGPLASVRSNRIVASQAIPAKFLVANKLPEPVTSELEIPDAWSSQ
jgi:hypothetical protein